MKKILLLCLLLSQVTLWSQTNIETAQKSITETDPLWVQMMYVDTPNLGDVVTEFEAYYKTNTFVKNGHTQYLKRWLRETETYEYQRIDPSFTPESQAQMLDAERQYLQARNEETQRNGSWTTVGPIDWDHDAANTSYAPGAAHVYTIEQAASNSDVLYAGTATCGLWKSTDHGGSWTNMTKDMLVNQVYAIEINHSDPNTVYASMFNSIYKTTDGGTSWFPTGDAGFQSTGISTKDMRMTPGNSSSVWAATDGGLFHTTNGGSTWTEVLAGSYQEIEFHPTNSSIIYVIKQIDDRTEFYKSTDSGSTFNIQTTGWPTPPLGSENKRAEIAVSLDNPSKVYALLTGKVNGGNGLYGVYISNDLGATWAFSCCGPQPGGAPNLGTTPPNINMMAWSDTGSDDGGQFYYDLGFAVSPTDEDKIFVGAVNLWVSSDGGTTFTCPAKWSHSSKPNYVHADIHDIHYNNNGELWVSGDGGIFLSTDVGANFSRQIYGIAGSDLWGFGSGFWDDEVMLGGAYHNGTLLKNGDVYTNGWVCTDGGDGTGGFTNFAIDDQVYSNYNIKTLSNDRTIGMATRGYSEKPFTHYTQGRSSKIEFHPQSYQVSYFGTDEGLWKTEDDFLTSEIIYDFGEQVADIEVAWADPNVIYLTTWPGYWNTKKVYKTINGGANWTEITPSTAYFSSSRHIEYDLEVDSDDPNTLWLARVGRNTNDNNKIFKSTDGGSSWTNISSATLDGEVLTNVVHQRGSSGGLYLGTTRTVYYKDNSSGWQLFANGLPASIRSRQLNISYANNSILNGTNRSAWKSGLITAAAPHAQIAVNKFSSACARDTFHFVDHSAVLKTGSWNWSFPGAAWVSSTTERKPKVVYSTSGTYDVSLTVSDINGSDSQTLTDLIVIGDGCSPEEVSGNALRCSTSADHARTPNINLTSNTITISAWVKPNGIQPDYTGIFFNDGTSAGLNFKNNNQLAYHWPGGSTHWAWNSGLFAPTNEWSYVAIVFEPTKVTLYLNDQKVERNTTLSAVDFTTMRIGSYKDWSSRNFDGDIDEVVMWNRALTQDEIRLWRHLTKEHQATPADAAFDEDLVCYYQFNEDEGVIYDRYSTYHASLIGSATRNTSSAPVGTGTSSKMTVNSGGTYNFSNEGVQLVFPSSGTFPNEEIIVSKLQTAPDDAPANMIDDGRYWVINNYGTSPFSTLESIRFSPEGGLVSNDSSRPHVFQFNKRNSNADGSSWGSPLDQAETVSTFGGSGQITFSTGNNLTSFSQFAISKDLTLLPVEFLDLWLTPTEQQHVMVNWETATEENSDYFEVEHSIDGREFRVIGQVSSANSISGGRYQFLDKTPASGINYYRIRAIDFDESYSYSQVKSIRLNSTDKQFKIYPNPTSVGGELFVEPLSVNEEFSFQLFSVNGQLITEVEQLSGLSRITLGALQSGLYIYKIIHEGGQEQGRLVVVK